MAVSKAYLTSLVKNILITEEESEFNVGDALEFLRQKEGRTKPRKFIISALKSGNIENLAIPEDFENNKDLMFIYKSIYAPDSFTQEDLHIEDNLNLSDYGSLLAKLPNELKVDGDVYLKDSSVELPRKMHVGQNLLINNIGAKYISNGIHVNGDMSIYYCIHLKHIEDNIEVIGNFGIDSCPQITHLPEGLFVKSLTVNNCPITSLPNNLRVKKSISLQDSRFFTHLPNKLKVNGGLFLGGCTSLAALPDYLKVKGNLGLRNCTSLEELPRKMTVEGTVFFHKKDPIARKFKRSPKLIQEYIKSLGGKVLEVSIF